MKVTVLTITIEEQDDASWDESMKDLSLADKWKEFLKPILYEEGLGLAEVVAVSEAFL
jgi:hypothetical protein